MVPSGYINTPSIGVVVRSILIMSYCLCMFHLQQDILSIRYTYFSLRDFVDNRLFVLGLGSYLVFLLTITNIIISGSSVIPKSSFKKYSV